MALATLGAVGGMAVKGELKTLAPTILRTVSVTLLVLISFVLFMVAISLTYKTPRAKKKKLIGIYVAASVLALSAITIMIFSRFHKKKGEVSQQMALQQQPFRQQPQPQFQPQPQLVQPPAQQSVLVPQPVVQMQPQQVQPQQVQQQPLQLLPQAPQQITGPSLQKSVLTAGVNLAKNAPELVPPQYTEQAKTVQTFANAFGGPLTNNNNKTTR